jgi:uncharacterized protein with HEPN domain
MRQRDALAHLYDVARACELLERFTQGRTFDDYADDPLLRSAVERQFEIVGEALKRAVDLEPGLAKRITGTSRIVAFRNRLIHGYASVSDEVVWGIVERFLPPLQEEVSAVLAEEGTGP